MKIRIAEKRGKFRVACKPDSIPHVDKYVKKVGWLFKKEFEQSSITWDHSTWLSVSPNPEGDPILGFGWDNRKPIEFDTYQKAENYVKKHWGLEGVKSIEEPDWKVA